jgi:hypothetical protein
VIGDLIGKDVDQLDDPVGVSAAGGGDEICDRLAVMWIGSVSTSEV